MRKEVFINKVVVTPESKFDYEEIMNLGMIPKKDIIDLVEDYIDIEQTNGNLFNIRYFRLKYFDEVNDVMLMLFFYKGETFGLMQMWKLAGICKEEDWNEDLEEDGQIRNWLNSKIEDLPDEVDWVERLRLYEEQEKTYQKELEERR